MEKLWLKLYVAGQASRTTPIIADLTRICEQQLNMVCEVDIIDILEHPQVAIEENILTTPTLIRHAPLPRRRITGDLSDIKKVLLALDLPLPSHKNNQP